MADDANGTATADAAAGTGASQSAADAAVAASTQATDDSKASADATAAAGGAAKQEVTYDLKLPEGSALDPALLTRTAAIARERGLTNEQAQAMVDLTASESASHVETALKSYQPGGAEWTKQVAAWRAQTESDPTLGPTPEARQAAVQKGIAVINRYAETHPDDATAFKEFLNVTGIGDHPVAAKLFAWLGESASEGSHITGEKKTREKTPEEKFYPAMAKTE